MNTGPKILEFFPGKGSYLFTLFLLHANSIKGTSAIMN